MFSFFMAVMKIFNKIILFSLFILLIGCKNNQDDDLSRLKASLALKNIQGYENSKSTEYGQYNLEILIKINNSNPHTEFCFKNNQNK